jgi:hypothetical protein
MPDDQADCLALQVAILRRMDKNHRRLAAWRACRSPEQTKRDFNSESPRSRMLMNFVDKARAEGTLVLIPLPEPNKFDPVLCDPPTDHENHCH